jgi:hypothetical protein
MECPGPLGEFPPQERLNPDTDTAGYLRLTAENKDHADHTPDRVTAWKEYQKLQAELRKFDNLRPIGGSVNITTATELGHSDSPPTFVRFGGIHERPTEEVQPGIPPCGAATRSRSRRPPIRPAAAPPGQLAGQPQQPADRAV